MAIFDMSDQYHREMMQALTRIEALLKIVVSQHPLPPDNPPVTGRPRQTLAEVVAEAARQPVPDETLRKAR